MINGQELQNVKKYKYLGIVLTYNGSMLCAQEHLVKRAVKAWFSIRNSLYSQKIWLVNIYIKSFETVIKPIILYICEIWGQPTVNRKNSSMLNMPKFDLALPCERLHIKICKQILCVPKKATNISVLGELGRCPMDYNILNRVIMYYTRLEGIPEISLLYRVFIVNTLNDNRLCNIVRNVEEQLNCTTENIDFKYKLSVNTCIGSMKNSLNSYFENLFFSFMLSEENKKPCTYKYFKNMFCIEPYLKCIEDPYIRKGLTCFRISAHGLRVETGRYKRIDQENRTCLICISEEIEDEFHFIMECPEYRSLIKEYLYQKLLELNNEHQLNDRELFVQILRTKHCNFIVNIAKFIQQAMVKWNSRVFK